MKIRITAVIVSLAISIGLLFSGYMIFMQFTVKKPIQAYANDVEALQLESIEMSGDTMQLKVHINKDGDVLSDYRKLKRYAQNQVSRRDVSVQTLKNSTLQDIWHQEYFAFSEALNHQNFSHIPQMVNRWKDRYDLTQVDYEMDEQDIYVYLANENDQLLKTISVSDGGGETDE